MTTKTIEDEDITLGTLPDIDDDLMVEDPLLLEDELLEDDGITKKRRTEEEDFSEEEPEEEGYNPFEDYSKEDY